MGYRLVRKLLFRIDAESAHELVAEHLERIQSIPLAVQLLCRLYNTPPMPKRVWGLTFRNPLGIAAGFDKNARMIPALRALGFGFIEVGTVTPRPQAGNPRPRLFRYPEQLALVNRLGFNNDGAEKVAARLCAWNAVELRETSVELSVPLFVNIGKNRLTPLDRAAEDYLECYRALAPHTDGVVVNVSSPNTPDLRDLQRGEHLAEILELLQSMRKEIAFSRPGQHPILVKIAPDLTDAELAEIADVSRRLADGIVATNTTVLRDGIDGEIESGGLSGMPLFLSSTSVLRRLRQILGPEFPLIGVGGILTGSEARAKMLSGADLLQVYTGFVYGGPSLIRRVVSRLLEAEP